MSVCAPQPITKYTNVIKIHRETVGSTGGMTDEADSGLHTYMHICVSTHRKVESSYYLPCLERISLTLAVVLTEGLCLGQTNL